MARRAHGEGSYDYDERGDYWRWRGYYRDANGEHKRKEIVAKVKKNLKAKVTKFLEEMESSGVDAISNMTVAGWCKTWLEDVIKPSLKIRTHENYKCTCDNHIIPNFGKMKLRDLQVIKLQQFFNALTKTHAVSTVITIRNHMIIMLNAAQEYGYIKSNTAKRTKPPRRTKREIVPLTDAQIKTLLEVAEEGSYIYHGTKQVWHENDGMVYLRKSYYVAVLLAITTGMRQGEIFGLRWANVDLEQSVLRVKSNMVTSKGQGQMLDTPKTISSQRNILLPQKTAAALQQWKEYQSRYAAKWAGVFDNAQDLVFSNSWGKLVCVTNFNKRYFRKMLRCAGISDEFTFHALRHTHATQLLKNGVNVKVVSERLGHSSTSITMDIYAHALPDMQETAVQELDKIY